MINWDNFYVFATVSICLWLAGAVFALRSSSKSKVAIVFTSGGIIILGIFIAGLWIFLQRPPLRTMGETRLWYSFFMGIAGLLTYIRWKYRWILSFSTLLSTVFVIINLMKPEIHDQSLMPALQSVWFIPHVTVYMFSYSVLGCAFIIALTGLFRHKEEYLHTADNLVYAGVAFLSIGMLLGSLWAKGAFCRFGSKRADATDYYGCRMPEMPYLDAGTTVLCKYACSRKNCNGRREQSLSRFRHDSDGERHEGRTPSQSG